MKTTARLKLKNRFPGKFHSDQALPYPVTIIILVWNAVKQTFILLESIIELPLPQNAELLFVDNGSTDTTPDYLKQHQLKIIRNEHNLGYTKAVNQGIQACTTDVVLLNNDTAILQQNWLASMQQTAYEHNGIVGCRLINYEGKVVHAGGTIDRETLRGVNMQCDNFDYRFVFECPYVTFGCVYLRRDIIESVGLLDERFFAYCEDADYCLRSRGAGFRILVDGRVNLLHRGNATSKANKIDNQELIENSYQEFRKKWQFHEFLDIALPA